MADETTLAQALEQLSAAASELNAVSDDLGKTIANADEALKRLNLGITAWVEFNKYEGTRRGEYKSHHLGYARVNSKWGVALSVQEGNEDIGEIYSDEEWLFNDAPRWLRIEALDHLPTLLEKLAKSSTSAVSEMKQKMTQVQQFTTALRAAVNAAPSSSRK